MSRLLTIPGLGVALACIAVPATAQVVSVDVGIHAGPIDGRVVYGVPPVYPAPHPPHVAGHPDYDWAYAGRAARYDRKHEKRWRKAHDKYHKRLRKLERERAKAERKYEREYRRWRRDVARHRRY